MEIDTRRTNELVQAVQTSLQCVQWRQQRTQRHETQKYFVASAISAIDLNEANERK